MAVVEPTVPANAGVEDKGLKTGALGLASSVVIGVASTAPGTASPACGRAERRRRRARREHDRRRHGGENPISGAILGSVVLKLVQRASRPLLIVPTREG